MADRLPLIVYIMGPTCAGKSELIDAALVKWGQKKLGVVQVGKVLRSRYASDHFKGQANPAHVHNEALDLYQSLLNEQLENQDVEVIFIDGQPRQGQTSTILNYHPELRRMFIQLDASVETRSERIKQRFINASNSDIELARKRIDNDRLMGYDTLIELLKAHQHIEVFDTSEPLAIWTHKVVEHVERRLISDINYASAWYELTGQKPV